MKNKVKDVTADDDDDKQEIDEQKCIDIIIECNNQTMTYKFSNNTELWTAKLFTKLGNAIKSHFNLCGEFVIYHKANNAELEDIDDIKDEYEAQQDDCNFVNLHLVIELTESPSTKQISKV